MITSDCGASIAHREATVSQEKLLGKGNANMVKLELTRKTNGVDTTRLQDTISPVKTSPELGKFKFRIENRWIDAGENRSEVKSFYGCGQELSHKTAFTLWA